MKEGRPTDYNDEILIKANEYLSKCIDEETEYHATRGVKSDGYQRLVRVKLPTNEGLAVYLDVNKDTVYEWSKVHPEFSDFMDKLKSKQAESLIRNGLSGDYNPTIAKVLLTKHGYREGIDATTNDKDISPVIDAKSLEIAKRYEEEIKKGL